MTRRAVGFTLVELLVAMAIMATVGAVFISLIVAGQAIARVQPEAADQQQRARMAIQALSADLVRAGAGVDRGAQAGPLARFFAPLQVSADGGITLWYVPGAAAGAVLTSTLARDDVAVMIDSTAAFGPGAPALVYDSSGCHDLLRVTVVSDTMLIVDAATRSCVFQAGATVAPVEVRTYRVDPAARQLQRRDETTGATLPVLDNVAQMQVELLDGGRRVRLSLQVIATARGVPDLTLAVDLSPPNLWLS